MTARSLWRRRRKRFSLQGSLPVGTKRDFYQHSTGPAMADRTLFDGVFQVPPAVLPRGRPARTSPVQVLGVATIHPRRNWPIPVVMNRAYVEEFSAVFEEAIRLRMRADVPVGCYLSGGLDSCATLGFASRNATTPIKAFTLSFDQAAYDESQVAQEMAQLAGADFHPIPIRQADIADHFEQSIWNSETLCSNGHGVSKFLLSRAVRDAGYKVVYTGEGSDEIFGGYVHFRTDMLRYNNQGQDPAQSNVCCTSLKRRMSSLAGCSFQPRIAAALKVSSACLASFPVVCGSSIPGGSGANNSSVTTSKNASPAATARACSWMPLTSPLSLTAGIR